MRIKLKLFLGLLIIMSFSLASYKVEKKKTVHHSVLWTKKTGKYNNYRIPSVIVTKKGSVLAFCEAREGGDTGDIDILVKRSTDNGKTWSDERVVWDDEKNTCGNPCPVVDEKTGRIWLILTWNYGKDGETKIIHKTSAMPRIPYMCYSDDDGLSWSKPERMPDAARDTSWGWYATGPGIGIQLQNSAYKGRLVIPANHSYNDPKGKVRNGPYSYGAHVLLSDDSGKTWRKSQSILPGCNESQVAELSDGTLVMNMRSYNEKYSRAISYSKDGGETWSAITHHHQLVESVCQASILNFGPFKGKPTHLFTNPAVPVGRTHITLKASFDNCKSWPNSKLIYEGPSGYSCLTKLANGRVGLFFEAGKNRPDEKMIFVSFPFEEISAFGPLLNAQEI